VYSGLTLLVEMGIIPRLAKRAQRAWQAARSARVIAGGYGHLDGGGGQQAEHAQHGSREPEPEDEDVREEREAIQVGTRKEEGKEEDRRKKGGRKLAHALGPSLSCCMLSPCMPCMACQLSLPATCAPP
jgi:hypothetical protein